MICTYHSAVADLQRLNDVQQQLGGLLVHEQPAASGRGAVDLEGAEDGAEGSRGVGNYTRHAHVVRLPWDILETECFANCLLCTSSANALDQEYSI